MSRFPIRLGALAAAATVAAAVLAAGCGSGSPTSAASGATSGGFSQIQGPQGEPVLDAKCQMVAPQQNLPTFELSLSSPTGAGQGVQSATILFSNGVTYQASFYPITVPATGVVTSTTTAAAYPPGDSMPTGCRVTAYNMP